MKFKKCFTRFLKDASCQLNIGSTTIVSKRLSPLILTTTAENLPSKKNQLKLFGDQNIAFIVVIMYTHHPQVALVSNITSALIIVKIKSLFP